jgi:hypothetical protein
MHYFRSAFAGALVAFVAACATDSTAPDTTRPPTTSADPLLVGIAAEGFDTVGVRDLGDSFLVEGDISIAKSIARKWAGQGPEGGPHGPELQWRTTNLVGQTKIYGLKVYLSGLASLPEWETAARSALTQWNNVANSAVYLVEGTPADIEFRVEYESVGGCGVAAQASWPNGVSPGPTITVYSNYCGTPNNSSTRLRNIVHEIGHTVGFRHSNWWCRVTPFDPCASEGGESDPGAIQVPGTPTLDANSVMNGGTADVAWSGFSTNDLLAIRTLYPKVASVVINFGNVIEDVTGPNSWNFGVSVSAYDINGAYIPGKAPQSITFDHPAIAQINGSGLLEGLQPGSTTLRAQVDGFSASAPVQISSISITGPATLGMTESGTFTGLVTGPGGPYVAQYWTAGEHNPLGCNNQASCIVTGSQVWYTGEGYMQVIFLNQSTGNWITAWVNVGPE